MLRFRNVDLWRIGGVAGAAVRSTGKTLCIDALDTTGCDYLLYTHSHEGHFPGGVGSFYSPFGGMTVNPGDVLELGPFKVAVVHAYNVTKTKDGKPIHPKGFGVGYLVEANGVRIYHMGDTDLIKEMTEVKDVDVLLVPIGGGSVMTPEEAADAVALLRPKIAVPIHYTDKKHYVKFRDAAHPYTNVIALHAPISKG
ncbi:MAG: MBL fold metallo-hydrolase [Pyrobaculum sp.]|nr:MBL fold metallo-hydrolase [Pyrobaculum sp.]